MPVWAYISFGCNCVSLSCLLSCGWFYSLMAVNWGQLSQKWHWAGLGLQGSLHGPGAVSFVFFFFGSIQLDAESISFDLYLVLLLYLVFLSFLLSFVLLLWLSLSLPFVWVGYSLSWSIANPLNPGPESAWWRCGQCGLIILYIESLLE